MYDFIFLMSREIKLKRKLISFLALFFVLFSLLPSYAGEWRQEADGRWWFENSDGSYPHGGMVTIGDEMYVFDGSGYMITNDWVNFTDGTWCYCTASGAVARNQWIDGLYYVDGNGMMLTNCWTPDGYYVGPDGAWMQSIGKSGASSSASTMQSSGISYAVVGSGSGISSNSSGSTKANGIYAPSSSRYSSGSSSSSSSSGGSSNSSSSGYSSGSSYSTNRSSSSSSGYSGTYYWTATGSKYHFNKYCNGLNKAKKIYSGTSCPSGLSPCSLCAD